MGSSSKATAKSRQFAEILRGRWHCIADHWPAQHWSRGRASSPVPSGPTINSSRRLIDLSIPHVGPQTCVTYYFGRQQLGSDIRERRHWVSDSVYSSGAESASNSHPNLPYGSPSALTHAARTLCLEALRTNQILLSTSQKLLSGNRGVVRTHGYMNVNPLGLKRT